jgi:hypothetical protein
LAQGVSPPELSVEAIKVASRGFCAVPVHAESYLAGLSEAEWTNLRHIARITRNTDTPALRCAECDSGVYARESPNHRRHCYHFAGDHSRCPWANATAGNIHLIDAEKFHGQQEGDRHRFLSDLLVDVLSLNLETQTAGVHLRRYLKFDGERAYPDVYAAMWHGYPAAFEVQLSTTHLPVIARREEFYEKARIRLTWIVSPEAGSLGRRTFRDIYMRNDGQIFGIDAETAEAAHKANETRFRIYRLLPGPVEEGFVPQWRNRIVGPAEIDWGIAGSRPRSKGLSYDRYLDQRVAMNPSLACQRKAFYEALKAADEDRSSNIWDAVSAIVGGCRWNELPPDSTLAFGVLASLRTGTMFVPTRIRPGNLIELSNSMLLVDRR